MLRTGQLQRGPPTPPGVAAHPDSQNDVPVGSSYPHSYPYRNQLNSPRVDLGHMGPVRPNQGLDAMRAIDQGVYLVRRLRSADAAI